MIDPPTNQTVPDNLAGNVTYTCTIPSDPNLMVQWEVDNLQISVDRIELFEGIGIFIEDEATLVFTRQVRTSASGIFDVFVRF